MTFDDLLHYVALLLITGGALYGAGREIADHSAEIGAIVVAVLQ